MTDFVIRAATMEDLPQMLVNGEAFFAEMQNQVVPFDRESMAEALTECIDAGLCFIAVKDDLHLGGIGGIKSGLPMNIHVDAAIERFFWMSKDERARGVGKVLLSTFADAARTLGCNVLIMIALTGPDLPYVERAYQKAGLHEAERTYIMRL